MKGKGGAQNKPVYLQSSIFIIFLNSSVVDTHITLVSGVKHRPLTNLHIVPICPNTSLLQYY